MVICVWVFPREDFADWKSHCGGESVSYEGYMTLLAAVQADQERAGHQVTRVAMSVAEMLAALDSRGWPNTPDRRAAVIALRRP